MAEHIFKADLADKGAEKSPLPFETGSRVGLTGICLAEANSVGRVDSFRLHLSGPEAVRILREPPWFNQRRLGIALASTLAAMTLSGLWIVFLPAEKPPAQDGNPRTQETHRRARTGETKTLTARR